MFYSKTWMVNSVHKNLFSKLVCGFVEIFSCFTAQEVNIFLLFFLKNGRWRSHSGPSVVESWLVLGNVWHHVFLPQPQPTKVSTEREKKLKYSLLWNTGFIGNCGFHADACHKFKTDRKKYFQSLKIASVFHFYMSVLQTVCGLIGISTKNVLGLIIQIVAC